MLIQYQVMLFLFKAPKIATIILTSGTKIDINDVLYSTKFKQNLLNFKDIRWNGYHIETMNNGSNEYLLITSIIFGKKHILKKLHSYSCGLYQTTIRPIESYVVINQKFCDLKAFIIWHERLNHPKLSMMRRIINNSFGLLLKNHKILMPNNYNLLLTHKAN